MKAYQFPNEISLGHHTYFKIINTGELHICNDETYTTNAHGFGGGNIYKFPDSFEIVGFDTAVNGENKLRYISLKYGAFFCDKLNDTLLLSGHLCTLYKIKKDFQNYKFIGNKPFLKII